MNAFLNIYFCLFEIASGRVSSSKAADASRPYEPIGTYGRWDFVHAFTWS